MGKKKLARPPEAPLLMPDKKTDKVKIVKKKTGERPVTVNIGTVNIVKVKEKKEKKEKKQKIGKHNIPPKRSRYAGFWSYDCHMGTNRRSPELGSGDDAP